MTAEAPKVASIVDDFRNEELDSVQWYYTGTAPQVLENDIASMTRGLSIPSGTAVFLRNDLGGRRADLWDSEVVFIIGRWGSGAQCSVNLVQSNWQFSFLYDDGVMNTRSIENGVTYTDTFLDANGNEITNWNLKYLRIAHSAKTGKVEFYGGNNPDGSDQRIMTRTLGVTVGTLKPTASQIDNMAITMSHLAGGGSNFLVRAVNAPQGGLPRNPVDPNGYYYRDFNTWYGRVANGFVSSVNSMSHEWKVLATNSSNAVQILDTSLTNRVMQVTGDGAARTILRTGFNTTIKETDYEMTVTPMALPSNGYFGMFWRASSAGDARYQLNVSSSDISLNVYPNASGSYSAVTSPRTQLISVPLVTDEGTTYRFRVSHHNDKITVYRDDIEVLSFTDLVDYIRDPGHIGIDVGNTTSSTTDTVIAIDKIRVIPAYDESNFSTGIAFRDRGLGLHVKAGRRDQSPVTMAADPTVVGSLESKLNTKTKTVYHFTALGDTVDTATIQACQYHAREGRTNVIMWNSFNTTQLGSLATGSNSVIDAWAAAIATIPGTVYLAPLPYADLNTPWSPFGYAYTSTNSSATTTTITKSGAGWSTNQWVNGTIRFQNSNGKMYWSRIVSNTSSTITFDNIGTTPTVGYKFWVTGASSAGTASEFVAAWRKIRDRFRTLGTNANFVMAFNWAGDTDTQSGGGSPYTGFFDDLYPGDAYVDAFLIRAINTGLDTTDGATKWRSLASMLHGGNQTGAIDYVPDSGSTIYYKINAAAPNKPLFVVAGSAETHHRYNDFEHAFATAAVTATNSNSATNDQFDGVTAGSGGSVKYWIPPTISAFNPRSLSSNQRAIRFDVPTAGDSKWIEWALPTSGVNRVSLSFYYRPESIGSSTSAAFLADVRDASNPILRIRVDQTAGTVALMSPSNTTLGTLATTLVANRWHRFDLEMNTTTGTARLRVTPIINSTVDRPDSYTSQVTASSISMNTPRYVRVGSQIANQTYGLRNGFEIDTPKVSWDTTAETYSKAKWIDDALSTRGFRQVSNLIIMSSDQAADVPLAVSSRFGTNLVDTRLDASKYTLDRIVTSFEDDDPNRIHTKPQLRGSGYEPTAKVGNVEYMYLKETGYAPLYITPRMGDILLRDFNLGQAQPRAAIEQRAGTDGTRDYTKYMTSKAVSLDFVTFDDPSGSAAYYTDVISAWSNPRRRPTLIYKLKGNEERQVALRPEGANGSWSIDGVRSGFKESQIQFVAIDGKDFSTSTTETLVQPLVLTPVNTAGTASTSPIIRIYGANTGCLNPTITLVSTEQREGGNSARISFGSETSPVMVPVGCFLEIDMDNRTAYLNGQPFEGASYLRHMTDRQWFSLDPYYNMIYFETDDTNGFASVITRDAFL